jgi:hypothetical protein
MPFRRRVRLCSLLARQVESLHDRIKHRVARRTELQGDGPLEQGAIVSGPASLSKIISASASFPEACRSRSG